MKKIIGKNFLKEAVVLLIAIIMISSTVIVTGNLLAPPDNPTINGPTEGDVGISYTYSFSTIDPDGDDVFYWVDWDDGTNSGWLGPYSSGGSESASHSWSEGGTYCIKVKAKDIYGTESGWSDQLCVEIEGGGGENSPPTKPNKPNGATTGLVGEEYRYTTYASDPDNDLIEYGFEWTKDSIPDEWVGMYQSGATCEIFLSFDEADTYELRVLARDEHGASSSFSPVLTIVISEVEECGEFMGIQVCPIGNATLDIGENIVVSNSGTDDPFGVRVELSQLSCDVYSCELENPLAHGGGSIKAKVVGTYDDEAFQLEMSLGEECYTHGDDVVKNDAFGIYPVGFNGAASGAPSIIAWNFGDNGNDTNINYYEVFENMDYVNCPGYLDLSGNYSFTVGQDSFNEEEIDFRVVYAYNVDKDTYYSNIQEAIKEADTGDKIDVFGIYPVGFNGAASGAPSIAISTPIGGKWTWGGEVNELSVDLLQAFNGLVCTECGGPFPGCKCYDPLQAGNGNLDFVEIMAEGIDNFTMNNHMAKKNLPPSTPSITGPTNGKTGVKYNYSITSTDSDDSFVIHSFKFSETPGAFGIYPVGFDGTASGAPSIIGWNWSEEGDYNITVRAFDKCLGYSDVGILRVSMPKSKTINTPFLTFLENHPHLFPLLWQILGL